MKATNLLATLCFLSIQIGTNSAYANIINLANSNNPNDSIDLYLNNFNLQPINTGTYKLNNAIPGNWGIDQLRLYINAPANCKPGSCGIGGDLNGDNNFFSVADPEMIFPNVDEQYYDHGNYVTYILNLYSYRYINGIPDWNYGSGVDSGKSFDLTINTDFIPVALPGFPTGIAVSVPPFSVPEPGTTMLIALGLSGLSYFARRRS